jgi:SAM-dependent methyltransferase
MSLYAAWRARDDGWSALICEPLVRAALGHLEEDIRPGAVFLDVGCGIGHVACAVAAAGHRALGVDPDLDALREARRRDPSTRWLRGTAEALPVRDASVDRLFSLSVLQYTDRETALAECSRVLRPGGRFAIVENLAGNPVAAAFRVLRRAGVRPPPEYAPPRAHPRWGDRRLYERYFGEVRFRAFHLAVPALVALPAGRRGPTGGTHGSGIPRLLRAIRGADTALLQAIPPLRHAAWMCVAYGTR